MAIRTVLYQSVFGLPQLPTAAAPTQLYGGAFASNDYIPVKTLAVAALVAGMQFSSFTGFVPSTATAFAGGSYQGPDQVLNRTYEHQFSAWHSPFVGTKTPNTPAYTPFDEPRAPQYSAAQQQFTAWHSPFVGTQTPITPAYTPFDAPRAPREAAAQQQFSAFPGLFVASAITLPNYAAPDTPFDTPQAPKYSAAEQQFTSWHSPFVGTQTPASEPPSTPFDEPRAPQYNAAQQQFSATTGFLPAGPAQTPSYAAPDTQFDAPQAPKYNAAQQQFSATTGFVPPPPVLAPNTPFDASRAPQYSAVQQQFTAWNSPFVGTATPNSLATFTQFDAPQAPKYGAWQQQFSAFPGIFAPTAATPTYLSTFTAFDEPVRLTIPPALLQFIDFGMGPEVTTATETIGRWGPDETPEERRRRHKAGTFFQWEEQPARSEFDPDPVEHPPHEPQKTADEPAYVRGVQKSSSSDLAAVLNQQMDDEIWDDPDIRALIDEFLANGTKR